jgi:hypothetical protein
MKSESHFFCKQKGIIPVEPGHLTQCKGHGECAAAQLQYFEFEWHEFHGALM